MRSRLELKAAARRARISGKVKKASIVEHRDPDKPWEDVPVLKIGSVRVKTTQRTFDDTTPRGVPAKRRRPLITI